MSVVRFDSADVAAFSAASHDRNPLHLCVQYARATAFGERIVFGVLAALPVLARVPVTKTQHAQEITLTFRRPVFPGRTYEIADVFTEGGYRGGLLDLSESVLTASVRMGPARYDDRAFAVPSLGSAPRRHSHAPAFVELTVGQAVTGWYRAGPELRLVTDWLDVWGNGLSHAEIETLMCVSYLAGMELPGRQALVSRIAMRLSPSRPATACGFRYRAEITAVDPRVRLIRVRADFEAAGIPFAQADIDAFWRPPTCPPDMSEVARLLSGGPQLVGRTAVVVGASRGLGAYLSLALAHQGANVTGCYQISAERAAQVHKVSGGLVQMVRGDASDSTWCKTVARDVACQHEGLDLLACVAAPALHPIRLSTNSTLAIADYVSRSTALVAAPIAAFIPLLRARRGRVLVVSSQAVLDPVADWPHYVAAKSAIEGLVGSLQQAHPNVRFETIRPPRLATEFVESLSAADPGMSPAVVAANAVRQLFIGDEVTGLK